MVTAIGWFIVILAVITLPVAVFMWASGEFDKPKKKVIPKNDIKSLPLPHKMSRIGRALMTKYNKLPEVHRPAFDFRAAIVALDVKYGIDALDNHFENNELRFFGPSCECTTGPSRKTCCQKAPEFAELHSGIRSIQRAMIRLEQANAEREREIELAGVENDLRSVPDILAALRAESKIIHETAKEISPR